MTSDTSREARSQQWQEARRLAGIAHGRLVESGCTVAVAESLTGGLISALLTATPGASVTFRGGLVVYATDLKHTIAGVRAADLEEHGPVHAVVAEQLASGARERLQADYGIGATGVAGPDAQDGCAVGETYVAIASDAQVAAKHYRFGGSRDEIRLAAVAASLSDLVDAIERRGDIGPSQPG